ncbi:hypothetical protein TCAL_02283 [Tigriopus californicus]|uniref:Uncharacterized protein n=2 Tax=Tigriopus californicus TaxID=6832 RepID=A0A553NPP2_TIGCA|nr:uncharacterized protein LOC131879659 isoform X2 [Tigriopus californicus]TRY67395.1 hypothetical protein TCAL_02283 [Tigriopus californicus]|eukprot:TCALIF_02283-PA protein Name:"Protein of unknown function" AED:0.00 eAED:0.00 QI:2/1/1/1/1/1/3/315/297
MSFRRSKVNSSSSLKDLDVDLGPQSRLKSPKKSPRKLRLKPKPQSEPTEELDLDMEDENPLAGIAVERRVLFSIDKSKSFDSIAEHLQSIVNEVKSDIALKQRALELYRKEIQNMDTIFMKVIAMEKEAKSRKTEEAEPEDDPNRFTFEERMEFLQTGPFTIVFHGMEPDWIEEEMDDDPDFQRDVLELRIKKLFKDELGMIREIPLVDVFRYTEGPRINNAAPIIVSFKNRKDKEQLMWRCKDKMKSLGLLVTEDSTARLKKQFKLIQEHEESQKRPQARKSPAKKPFRSIRGRKK